MADSVADGVADGLADGVADGMADGVADGVERMAVERCPADERLAAERMAG